MVFDVLGQLTFEDRPLRELLLEAIRYGDQPTVRSRLFTVVDRLESRRVKKLAFLAFLLWQRRPLEVSPCPPPLVRNPCVNRA